MVEEKAGVEKQNSEKGFEKNEHACIVEGVVGFRIFLPVWYLKLAGPTRKIQSSSQLRQIRKGNAEIQDTPLGLTGIGKQPCQHLVTSSDYSDGPAGPAASHSGGGAAVSVVHGPACSRRAAARRRRPVPAGRPPLEDERHIQHSGCLAAQRPQLPQLSSRAPLAVEMYEQFSDARCDPNISRRYSAVLLF